MPTVVYEEERFTMWSIVSSPHEFGDDEVELVLRFPLAVKNDGMSSETILISEYCLKVCCP